jgi:PIN domain nuclease of toxin-antitoxin system
VSFLLVDTHLLLWASAAEERLPKAAYDLMADVGNTVAFSVVSFWEVVLKAARLRKELGIEPRRYREVWLDAGYRELPLTGDHVIAVARLPPLHKDPFDRILVAQAEVEGATLLTADAKIARYGGPVRFVR